MDSKSALILALLPGLLTARSVGNVNVRRRVDCNFSTAANPGDSCDSFAGSWGISVDKLKSLNPNLDCDNFDRSKEYCVLGDVTDDEPTQTTRTSKVVQVTTTSISSTSTSTSTETTQPPTTTTSANGHEPTQPGLAENCDKFHKIVAGDSCDDIVSGAGISHKQFSKWNPYIDDSMSLLPHHRSIVTEFPNNLCTECSNLWLDYYVCVHVPGAKKPSDDGHTPTQHGIAKNCDEYHKIVAGDQCDSIESDNKITHEQFLKWNPAINSGTAHILSRPFP